MSVWFRHIFCALVLILATCAAKAQENIGIDVLLDRYQRSCEECLNLRDRVEGGEKIPTEEAENMVQKFINLNRLLNDMAPELNDTQMTRFKAIGNWFRTGNKPLALNQMPLSRVTAVLPSANAVTHSESFILPLPAQTAPLSAARAEIRIYILPSISFSPGTYGAMAGVQSGRWGGYARFAGRFNAATPSYSCTIEGILNNGSTIWPNGVSAEKALQITAGPLYGLNSWLDIYAGLGYGRYQVLWQDIDGNWASVGQGLRGLCTEAGALASWKNFTFGAGVSTISFRSLTPTLSFGINF